MLKDHYSLGRSLLSGLLHDGFVVLALAAAPKGNEHVHQGACNRACDELSEVHVEAALERYGHRFGHVSLLQVKSEARIPVLKSLYAVKGEEGAEHKRLGTVVDHSVGEVFLPALHLDFILPSRFL